MHSSPQPSTDSGMHFSLVELSILIRVLHFINIDYIKGITDPNFDSEKIIIHYCNIEFNNLQMENKNSIIPIYDQLKYKLSQVDFFRINFKTIRNSKQKSKSLFISFNINA